MSIHPVADLPAMRGDFNEWAFYALKKINSRVSFQRKGCYIPIEDYVAKVPAGAIRVHGFLIDGLIPESSGKILQMFGGNYPLTPTTVHSSQYLGLLNQSATFKYAFVNGCLRFETLQTGNVYVEYDCVRIDADGYIMIPDTSTEAVASYFVYMLEKRQHYGEQGRRFQLQIAEKDWALHCVQARTEEEWPDLIEIRQIEGILNNMYPMADPNTF